MFLEKTFKKAKKNVKTGADIDKSENSEKSSSEEEGDDDDRRNEIELLITEYFENSNKNQFVFKLKI